MAENKSSDLPGATTDLLSTTLHAYLVTLRFIVLNTGRDPSFNANHLLSYLADDFIQSAVSVLFWREKAGSA